MSGHGHGPYGIILADPPWAHRDKAKAGKRGAGFKYSTMATEDIARLDVPALAARDCALLLWAAPPMIADALYVLHEWGFRFCTFGFVWVKTAPGAARRAARRALRDSWIFGEPGADDAAESVRREDDTRDVLDVLAEGGHLNPGLAWGMGQSTRANIEPVLLGVKGRLGRVSGGVHQVVMAPPGRHSAKPLEVHRRAVQLLGPRPRIELFARSRAPGWHAWGNDPALGTPDVELALRPRPVVQADLPLPACAPSEPPTPRPMVDPSQMTLLELCGG